MDEDARTAFRARWRERIEGDPTKVPHLQGHRHRHRDGRHRVLPAAVLRRDGDALRLPRRRRRRWCCTARSTTALKRFWTDTRERHRFLQHDRERPLLPPETLFLSPRSSSRCAKPHALLALRGTARRRRGRLGARRCPTSRVDRGAPEPLQRLQAHLRSDAAPRADRRRERRPAREPARAAARQPASSRRASTRWPSSRPATRRFAIAVAPLAEGFVWREPRRRRAIEFVTETELFATPPTDAPAPASRSRSATSTR